MKLNAEQKKHTRLLIAEMERCVDLLRELEDADDVRDTDRDNGVSELKSKMHEVRRDSTRWAKLLSYPCW